MTVIKTVPKFYKNKQYTNYQCKCDCGKVIITPLINVKSCGCFQKESVAERSRKQFGFSATNSMYNYYKRNAKTRNLQWDLSRDQFKILITNSCHYCKVDASDIFKKESGDFILKSGIDRMDNDIGYNINNCVSCCKICNRAKGTLDYKIFLEWIKNIKDGITI